MIIDSLYRAMREALNVPENDQFMTITEHDAANFRYGNAYGVARSATSSISKSQCSTHAPWNRRTVPADWTKHESVANSRTFKL